MAFQALILAAGLGSRLGSLTKGVPKCLLPVRGKPMLQHWFDRLIEEGLREVLVNTHHHAPQVENFASIYHRRHPELKIQLAYEKELLGTGGTIWFHQSQLDDTFLILNCDVFSNVSLAPILEFHKQHSRILTLTYQWRDNLQGCGVLEVNERHEVIQFEEKPENPKSHLVYAGILGVSHALFKKLPFVDRKKENYKGLDLAFDVFPRLKGEIMGYEIKAPLVDIGSLEVYQTLA